jgi:hypothetical protein
MQRLRVTDFQMYDIRETSRTLWLNLSLVVIEVELSTLQHVRDLDNLLPKCKIAPRMDLKLRAHAVGQ